MKKLTIKLKITLWFTVFMILLAAAVFAFIAVVSGSTTSHQVRAALTGLVNSNLKEVEYDDGEPDIDDDFVSYQNGVYCLVLNSAGEKLSGYAPYTELEHQAPQDGSIRSVRIGTESYLIYDRQVAEKNGPGLWVRGAVLEGGSIVASSAVYQAALIALPLFILLAAVGGYLLAGRLLRPIQEISQTAEAIGGSGDLSKRIKLAGNGKDELHRLADTFNGMFERLEANFEAERNFTSDASHELRTPVTTILAQCEYAFENAAGEQELYEAIGVIQRQGYRMSRLIESLLQLTRMEQRTEAPTFETLDISKLVQSVCREHRELTEKHISLTEDIQPHVQMKADTALLTRMLDNLLQNACRYGKENGKIAVTLKETDETVTLSVADDGIGIAAKDLPNIWNRFYRADPSRSGANGMGLGLAMVRQIAGLHHGKVQVVSHPGQGSMFTVILPKTEKQ